MVADIGVETFRALAWGCWVVKNILAFCLHKNTKSLFYMRFYR